MLTRRYRRDGDAAPWMAILMFAVSACAVDRTTAPSDGDRPPTEARSFIHVRPMQSQDLERIAARVMKRIAVGFPDNVRSSNAQASEAPDPPGYYAFTRVYLETTDADVIATHWITSGTAWGGSGSVGGTYQVGSLLPITVWDTCSPWGSDRLHRSALRITGRRQRIPPG